MAAFFFLPKQSQSLVRSYFDPCCFLRSAQRFRMASAMRLRPSGERRRLVLPVLPVLVALAVEVEGLCAAAFGRPGPRFAVSPVNNARACCRRDISESISCTSRLKSTIPPSIFQFQMYMAPTGHLVTTVGAADITTIQNLGTILQIIRRLHWGEVV